MQSHSQNQSHQNQNPHTEGSESWLHHPKLAGMDQSKLAMLQNLAMQGSQKNQSDLLPFLMAAANQSKEKGMSFQPDEVDTIIEVLKMGKSPQETAKMDRILSLMKMMRSK